MFEWRTETIKKKIKPEIQIDADTIRIRLPGKSRWVTFEVRGISEDFLSSPRTKKYRRKYAVYAELILPTDVTLQTQLKRKQFFLRGTQGGNNVPLKTNGTHEAMLDEYGITEKEFRQLITLAEESISKVYPPRK